MQNLVELEKIKELVKANLPVEIDSEGKFIRSQIGLLLLKASGLGVDERVIKFLAVVELIHNASIFHDDVIDNEEERRDNPALNKIYGEKTAILYGNITLSNALKILLEIDCVELVSEMNNCVKKMCYGELQQQERLNKISTINEYIKINRLKTASLFKFLAIGLVKLTQTEHKTLFESFSENFGIGFQISNDFNELKNGVENSKDVKNGIYTAPIIYAQSIKIDDSAIDKTKGLMDNYLRRAISVLGNLGKNEYIDALIGVIECLKN